jgi:NAD(P)-dependent dehydrogenase (short-subunit alcohol dehydrogenase family)
MSVLIIGAAGGIGTVLVDDLVDLSFNLLLGYRSNKPLSKSAESQPVDGENFQSVHDFVQYGLDKFGKIDGIVNLAGNLVLKPAHRCSEDEFDQTISKNLKTSFAVVKAAGSLLENCSVVLLSTAAAGIGLANHELISSAKSGVEGLVKSASKTYARKNIRFNSVAPGLISTPLSSKIISNPIALKASEKMHALGRIGEPKDISNMIQFLISPQNNWITGQNFVIDGGLSSTK